MPLSRIADAHRFLWRRSFYPLSLCTLLACSILAARIHLSGSRDYSFLRWNLFLAWVPYACALLVALLHRNLATRRWLLLAPALVWLVFLPNAPYILTDVLHLGRLPTLRWWFDVGMVLSFAWAGLLLGVVSLQIMHDVVRATAGRPAGWAFVLASAALSGVGVYVGRFFRWNSWDLLHDPAYMVASLVDSLDDRRLLAFSALFSALFLVCYLTFATGRGPHRDPAD